MGPGHTGNDKLLHNVDYMPCRNDPRGYCVTLKDYLGHMHLVSQLI